jgi:hypothetical protein
MQDNDENTEEEEEEAATFEAAPFTESSGQTMTTTLAMSN